MLDCFFTVLSITPSFLVHFLPVKYRIEALDMPYTLVRGQSVRSSFRSGQQSGQTLVKLGQPWSTPVKPGQPWSNFREYVPDLLLGVILTWWALVGSGWLGLGCLVLRADVRENPEGKNGVMTAVEL